MKKTIVVIGLVAMMLIGATYAFAQGPGSGPGPGRMGWRDDSGSQKGLSLTPDQKAKFQELRRKFNDETAQLRGSILTKRLELRSLWSNPKADPKAILDKDRELGDLQNQVRDKAFQMRLEARSLLTPEQFGQIGRGWRAGHGPRRGPMREHGGMMGYGPGPGRFGGMW